MPPATPSTMPTARVCSWSTVGTIAARAGIPASEDFICAMLAPAERKPEVVGILVDSLQRAQSAQGRAGIGKMLVFLTDQKLGDDPKAWKVWWDKQRAKPARQ